MNKLKAVVTIYDDRFRQQWRQERALALTAGPSVIAQELGDNTIPADYVDRFFFVVAELNGVDGKLLSRSLYWPRSLRQMNDAAFRQTYRATSQAGLTLDKKVLWRDPAQRPQARVSVSACNAQKQEIRLP